MSKQNIPDITVRDPFDYFTDREEILELFERYLHSAKPDKLQLLAIKGNIGTGKTFLISFLIKRVCSKLGWQTGLVSFNQSSIPDFRFILMGIEDALKGCVPRESLKLYREKRDEYNRSFDKYQAVISV